MEIDARVEAWAALQLLPGVSGRVLGGLSKAPRGPEPVLLARTVSWIAEPGHALVAWDDADYPRALLTISDPPPAFYYCGRRELLNRPAIAIVGSRNATP